MAKESAQKGNLYVLQLNSHWITLTFTLLSFLGVLAMLLKLEAGKGLKLFLHYNSLFLDLG